MDAKDDPKGLAMSVKQVEKIVTQLKEEEGIDPSKVVLGGFSQGGAVALMAAYNRRKKDAIPFAGCVCMSGWLPMKNYLDVSEESAKATPLFWAHGQFYSFNSNPPINSNSSQLITMTILIFYFNRSVR